VADAHHPLTRRRSIALADLVNVPWAMPPANTSSGEYIRHAFHANRLALPTTIVSTYSHVLRHHLVATGGFITVLPKVMCEIMAKGLSIKALPVRLPTARRTVVIVVLKKRMLSSIAQLFIAGVLPGLLLALLFSGYIVTWALFNREKIPVIAEHTTLLQKIHASRYLIPVVLLIETNYAPAIWLQMSIYLPFTLISSLLLLQPVKGAVVGFQWALRMHGFDENAPPEIAPG